MNMQVLHAHSYWRACSINLRRLFYYARAECKFTPFLCKGGTRRTCLWICKQHSKTHNWQTANPVQFWSIKCSCEGTFSLSGQRAARQMGLNCGDWYMYSFFARLAARYAMFLVIHHIPASSCIPYVRCLWTRDRLWRAWPAIMSSKGWGDMRLQRSAKVEVPGCVNAAGKLGRSDKLQQE